MLCLLHLRVSATLVIILREVSTKELLQKVEEPKQMECTWGVQVLRYPNFFSGMEADRNVKVVGGDVAVL